MSVDRPGTGRAALRILIADDQPQFRQFLRHVLETDPALKVVGEAIDGEQAVQLAERLKPDVVLMNMEMPGIAGLEAARQLKARRRETRVVLLSALGDEAHQRAALDGGADAFLPKAAPVPEIMFVVREVAKPLQRRRSSSV
jgi:two-component system response regulator DesR